jgi:D-serine deaminase-like pyridoxal phosphate-dependent protein
VQSVISQIKKPTLVIDEAQARRNIEKMAIKARRNHCHFRPHFKTHHAHEVGNWYRDYGVKSITCSSVSMAQYFASDGWQDITIAFPYNPLEAQDLNALAGNIQLQVLITSLEGLEHLEKTVNQRVGFFVKIDVGSHRTGLERNQLEEIQNIIQAAKKHEFIGYLAHAGHTYKARSHQQILQTHQLSSQILKDIHQDIGMGGLLSYGDTPACSVVDDLSDFDELRPGNLVYYDLMQAQITSCQIDEIAIALACPVVAKHRSRKEIVLYGGAVHCSKDQLKEGDRILFGKIVRFTNAGWELIPDTYLCRLSQEHGIISTSSEYFDQIHFGEVLGVLPVHSCLMADLMSQQITLEGKKITKMEKI